MPEIPVLERWRQIQLKPGNRFRMVLPEKEGFKGTGATHSPPTPAHGRLLGSSPSRFRASYWACLLSCFVGDFHPAQPVSRVLETLMNNEINYLNGAQLTLESRTTWLSADKHLWRTETVSGSGSKSKDPGFLEEDFSGSLSLAAFSVRLEGCRSETSDMCWHGVRAVMCRTAALSTARASVGKTVRSSPSEPGQSQGWGRCWWCLAHWADSDCTPPTCSPTPPTKSEAALKVLGKIRFCPRVFIVWGRQIPLRISESHFFTV